MLNTYLTTDNKIVTKHGTRGGNNVILLLANIVT